MIRKELGLKIKDLRLELGLSQEKFAMKAGIDRTYLASVEAGKRNVSLLNIQKIAAALEVPIKTLFEGIGDNNDK